uniref:Uncharacterized protein n=1 Tax=Meloidogyne hapla TaxID=6305 RepID=A0A1I8BLZ2_MELHA
MGVIQKDQTFCSCSPSTINTENNQQNQQSFNKFFDDKFPSKSIFSWNNDDNSKSSSSSSSSSSLPSFFNNNLWKSPSSLFGFSSIPSPQQQQNNNIFNSSFSGSTSQTSEKQIGIQKQQNQLNRPTPGNPSDGRHLFLSTSTQTSSATGLKRINKDGSLTAKIGRKIDFVGGIILLFVFDLLLLSLTI